MNQYPVALTVCEMSQEQADCIAHSREVRGTPSPLAVPFSIPAQAAPSSTRDGAPVFNGWSAAAKRVTSSVADASQPATAEASGNMEVTGS